MAAMQPDRIRRWLALPARLAAAISARARRARRRAALVALFVVGLGLGFAAVRLTPVLRLTRLPSPPARPEGRLTAPARPTSAALQGETGVGAPARAVAAAQEQSVRVAPVTPATPTGSSPPVPGTFLWPADGLIVSTTGWRRHPERGDWSYQPGLELAVPSRAPVRAAADGSVREVTMEPEGYAVTLDHGGGWSTRYTRLAAVSVRAGASVRRGGTVGYGPSVPESALPAMAGAGAAGAATAAPPWPSMGASSAIVGFEVRRDGEAVEPLRVMEPGWFRVAGDGDAALAGEGPPGEAGWSRSPVPGP